MIYIVFIFDMTRCGYASHIYTISMTAFIEYPHQFWKLPPATSRTTGICILGIIPRIGHHNAESTVLFSDNFTLWCLLWWIRRKLFFAARAPLTALFPWVHGRNSRNIPYSSPLSRSPNFTSGSELADKKLWCHLLLFRVSCIHICRSPEVLS